MSPERVKQSAPIECTCTSRMPVHIADTTAFGVCQMGERVNALQVALVADPDYGVLVLEHSQFVLEDVHCGVLLQRALQQTGGCTKTECIYVRVSALCLTDHMSLCVCTGSNDQG